LSNFHGPKLPQWRYSFWGEKVATGVEPATLFEIIEDIDMATVHSQNRTRFIHKKFTENPNL